MAALKEPGSESEQELLLNLIDRDREELAALQPDEATQRLIHDIARHRDRLIIEAISKGVSERHVAGRAGVTRGWIWKLKKGTASR